MRRGPRQHKSGTTRAAVHAPLHPPRQRRRKARGKDWGVSERITEEVLLSCPLASALTQRDLREGADVGEHEKQAAASTRGHASHRLPPPLPRPYPDRPPAPLHGCGRDRVEQEKNSNVEDSSANVKGKGGKGSQSAMLGCHTATHAHPARDLSSSAQFTSLPLRFGSQAPRRLHPCAPQCSCISACQTNRRPTHPPTHPPLDNLAPQREEKRFV